MSGAPLVTIVIPTRDRPAGLARCLAAVEAECGGGPVEIVVVDDGSRDAAAVAAVARRHPSVRLVRLEGRGPGAARNAGARVAAGPVLCLLDDDCEPRRGWLAALLQALERDSVVAGGNVNGSPGDPCATANHVIARHVTEASRDGEGRLGFAPSMNIACHSEVAARVPFDEVHFAAAGEDREWCARLREHGTAIAEAPDAVVVHRQRQPAGSFLGKHVRNGRVAYRLRAVGSSASVRRRPDFFAALIRAGFRERAAVGALVALAQVAVAVGYAGEALSDRSARRSASARRRRPTAAPRRGRT